MNVAEELREHAKRVEEGWVRGAPNYPGEACAVGWLPGDSPGLPEFEYRTISCEAEGVLGDYLHRQGKALNYCDPTSWSDRKPSEGGPVNRRQVAAVLRRAAGAWEQEQEEVA